MVSFFKASRFKNLKIGSLITGVISTSVVAVSALTQSDYISNFVDLIRLYDKGQPVETPKEILDLYESVTQDLKLSPLEKHQLKPFIINGFETHHVGILPMFKEAYIGIPYFYAQSDSLKIDKLQHVSPASFKRFSLFDVLIDRIYEQCQFLTSQLSEKETKPPLVKEVEESLMLSEKAKKFSIAQSIVKVNSMINGILIILPGFYIGLLYSTCVGINKWMGLHKKSKWIRCTEYSIICTILFLHYLYVEHFLNLYMDSTADSFVARYGNDYVEGGVEYYSKLRQRVKYLTRKEPENSKSTKHILDLYTISLPNENELVTKKFNLKRKEDGPNLVPESINEMNLFGGLFNFKTTKTKETNNPQQATNVPPVPAGS